MSKIPDDVVDRALASYYNNDPDWRDPLDPELNEHLFEQMRAAGDVFVEWALEEAAAYMAKTLPHLSLQEYAAAIRALKPKQDA
jgi:hypothetical protein